MNEVSLITGMSAERDQRGWSPTSHSKIDTLPHRHDYSGKKIVAGCFIEISFDKKLQCTPYYYVNL